MALTPLPTAPATSDPSTFNARMDAMLAALVTMVTEINAGQGTIAWTPADAETPAGSINGTDGTDGNAAFTLAHTPTTGSLILVKNDVGTGVVMIPGVHYNISAATITYTSGNKPIAGQTHRAWYRY